MAVTAEPLEKIFYEDLCTSKIPEKFAEIIEGELVVMTPADWHHNRVGYRFQRLFEEFCETHPGHEFGGDNDGFLLQRKPLVLLSPDASLFRSRPDETRPWREFAPELAVEVVSPSNSPSEIAYKRQMYFRAGGEQVWITDPEKRSLEISFQHGRRLIARGEDHVRAEGIADGLIVELAKIFRFA